MSDLSPLSGAEPKLHFGAVRSVDDPKATLVAPDGRVSEAGLAPIEVLVSAAKMPS